MALPLHPPGCPLFLQASGPGQPVAVCVGAEWYRFPSAFFLPGDRCRLRFIKSGFTGLLPRQFDPGEVRGAGRLAPSAAVPLRSRRLRPFRNVLAVLLAPLVFALPSACCVPQGGTRAAPPHFNDRNREEAANYWPSAAGCAYAVTLQEEGQGQGGAFIDELGERQMDRRSVWCMGVRCS